MTFASKRAVRWAAQRQRDQRSSGLRFSNLTAFFESCFAETSLRMRFESSSEVF